MADLASVVAGRFPPIPGFNTVVHAAADRTTVEVRGELCLSTIQSLGSCIEDLRAGGADQLVLDLRNLEFMDSCGILFLLTMSKRALAEGFGFAIIPGDGQPSRTLGMVGMSDRIPRATP
jgi:anti-anti-sigma factor